MARVRAKPELEFIAPFPVHECSRRMLNQQQWRFLNWDRKVEFSTARRDLSRFFVYSPLAKVIGALRPYDANSSWVNAKSQLRYTTFFIVALIGVVLVIGIPLVFTNNLLIIGSSIVLTLAWLLFLWYLGNLQQDGLMRFVKRVLEYQDKPVDVEPQQVSSFKRIM